MGELVTVQAIARAFGVDPKTAHYWAGRPWFPEPVQTAGEYGPTLYDLSAVQEARRRHLTRRRSNARAKLVPVRPTNGGKAA